MSAPAPNEWFVVTRTAGGTELRPHPRVMGRAAFLAAFLTWTGVGIGLGFLCTGGLVLSTAVRTRMAAAGGPEPVWRAVELGADVVGLAGAAVLLILATWRSYRRVFTHPRPPLVVAPDGAVVRDGTEYVAAGRARGVCVQVKLWEDGEGGTSRVYSVCVTDCDMVRIPVPWPEATFGLWRTEATVAAEALAFAALLGAALGVPVHPVVVEPPGP